MPRTVGFIGLGNMGGAIAANLVAHGFEVRGYDTRREAVDRLVGIGGTGAESPAAAASGRDCLSVCVVNDTQVVDVLFGPDGALTTDTPPPCVLVHSTIHPASIVRVAQRAADLGVAVLDTPVSAGTFAAKETGRLTVYVGGSAEVLERVRPVLAAIAQAIVSVGDVGAGQLAKLANNLVCQMACLGVGQAMRFGIAAGLDGETILQAVNAGSGRCWFAEGWPAAWMEADGGVARDESPELIAVGDVPGRVSGAGRNGLKDLGLAIALAGDCGVTLPFVEAVRAVLEEQLRERGVDVDNYLVASATPNQRESADRR